MKNIDNWRESKYEFKNGVLKSSSNLSEVSYPSRLMANAIGEFYSNSLTMYAQGSLLDLGCGKVPLFKAYQPFVSDITCVDWGNSLHKNDYLDFEADLNERLPLETNKFDTIILSDVLEHIKVPMDLWSEMSRVIKKDGYLIMNVPFYYWLHEEPFDYYRYTRFALKFMGEKHGFEVIESRTLGGFPEVFVDLMSRMMIHIPLVGFFLVRIIVKLTSFFIKTKLGRKFVNKTSLKFPYGYGMVFRKL